MNIHVIFKKGIKLANNWYHMNGVLRIILSDMTCMMSVNDVVAISV